MHPLLSDALGGDQRARDRLADLLYPETIRYVEHRMGARVRRIVAAEDLTQEVFARTFRSLPNLPEGADLDTLRARVRRIARWVISEHVAKAVDFMGESSAGFRPPGSGRARDAGEESGLVTRTDRADWLRSMVSRMPERYGEVILLRMDGWDFEDIARRLEESEAAVRKRYQRAIHGLQRILGKAQP